MERQIPGGITIVIVNLFFLLSILSLKVLLNEPSASFVISIYLFVPTLLAANFWSLGILKEENQSCSN
ncbi:hypothetical protein BDV28DRAFT_131636 [Aspergillus coremiiformis]|uniref:Uncharacterized protein n=1 Tax=Aspergillus coremiiformis TaxID=138285 RepID=A0A5N6ZB77_9EURO|nr:hypothetical protein BDV28DRAFT_131636 [Aspergillus coremiiformis]